MLSNRIKINFIPGFCICFCSGIALAAYLKIPLYIFYFCALLFLGFSVLSLKKDFRFGIFLLVFAVFFGAGIFRNSQTLPSCHIAKITPYKSIEVRLRGIVVTDPAINNQSTRFILSAKEAILDKKSTTCGKVQVIFFGKNQFSYGQELLLTGKLYRPANFGKGARFSYRDYLKQQGIYSLLSAKKAVYLRKNQGSPVAALAFWLKHRTQEILRRHISGVPVAVLEAMILGERQGIPAYLNTAMMHTGTIHILVVSGFNVGIVAFIVFLFLKIIRIHRRTRYFITILFLTVYCLMTGSSVPVVRATIMCAFILFGQFLRREAHIYDSLSLSALIILLFYPMQLFNIGFQLSFSSVLSIICLYPEIYRIFPDFLREQKAINRIIQVFAVSFAAWLGTIGLVAYYFNIIPVIGILANMIIAPFASLITACGLSLVLISLIIAPAAFLFAATAESLALILIRTNMFFSGFSWAYFKIFKINLLYAAAYYLALILFVFFHRQWYNSHS